MVSRTSPRPPSPDQGKNKKQNSRRTADKYISLISEVLKTGAATRLPIVQSAFGSAARILEITESIRKNTDDFVDLAEEACRLVYAIGIKLQGREELDDNLEANLVELQESLDDILKFGQKYADRGVVKAMLRHGFDAGEIKRKRTKLERCMRLFEFQSLLELRQRTNEAVDRQIASGEVTMRANNQTENNVRFGNEADFSGAVGAAFGAGNATNINSNANGGGTSNTNKNNNTNNKVEFGDGAKFTGSTGATFGANNTLNINSSNRTNSGNTFGSDNTLDTPHINGSQSTNTGNTTTSAVSFGNSANFAGSGANIFGSGNQVYSNSNNRTNNMTAHNNGHNNVNVMNRGNHNSTHIGDNNANNRGIIGNGSHNVINSGDNTGPQFFPHASNFTISGGDFSNVAGNSTANSYNYGRAAMLPN